VIEAGAAAPEFTLPDHGGRDVSLSSLRGGAVVLCFYPNDFSPVCTDQLSIYQEVNPELDASDAALVGISVDHSWSHRAFRKQLGLEFPLLSDFHPKGEVARAYGAYIPERGHSNRSLVLVDAEGMVRWAYESPPLEVPGANLIFDALAGLR
jgi:peroxiredoxin